MRRPRTVGKADLDELYDLYTRREYVHPDPLEALYPYEDVRDREIVGLVASALAYGRAAQICRSVASALEIMGSPRAFVEASSERSLRRSFAGFRHRWTSGDDLAALLSGAAAAIARHGSLEKCFLASLSGDDETVLPALGSFVGELRGASRGGASLLPVPERGSACKRLHLYLRWMVRVDSVDPGGWEGVPTALLVCPLDTHMHRIGKALALTRRRAPDRAAALEVTRGLSRFDADDPVRYDFALTRLGIRADADLGDFLERFSGERPPRRRKERRHGAEGNED